MSRPVLGRRLTLEAAARQTDGAGGYRVIWTVLGDLWARVSQARFVQGQTDVANTVSWVVTVRGAPMGSPRRPVVGQRFREGTRVFRIIAVTEADLMGRYLDCVAREEAAQ